MATPEIPRSGVHVERSQMTVGDPGQEAILEQGLASEPIRQLLKEDAVEAYRRALADLGCSAEDVQRNSEKFRTRGAKRQIATAYVTRIAAASVKGNGNRNGAK